MEGASKGTPCSGLTRCVSQCPASQQLDLERYSRPEGFQLDPRNLNSSSLPRLPAKMRVDNVISSYGISMGCRGCSAGLLAYC